MKIYNEIISKFNEATGKWDTISEDSFEDGGPIALAQGVDGPLSLPSNATAISSEDTITETIKTTTGYFTNGDGTISGNDIHTASLGDTNEKYYFNVCQTHPLSKSAETQFAVTYGHIGGSGSNQFGDSTTNNHTIVGEAQAVYKQLSSMLLTEAEQSGGFKISAGGTQAHLAPVVLNKKDEFIYALIGKRNRFKDRFNKKTWTMSLSGSLKDAEAGTILSLTDDSAFVPPAHSPAGPRYNIISGALGVASGSSDGKLSAAHRTFGHYYPDMGIMLFSGNELSHSIPGPMEGPHTINAFTASFLSDKFAGLHRSASGFTPNLDAKGNSNNAMKFVACLRNNRTNTALRIRAEEDQTQFNYFCRIKAGSYNFSNNPTFTSGSKNKIRQATMVGNPTTFISGLGLYNAAGQLLATAKLSSPLKKNFASEATVKVKLTY
tara:strand:- start:277 stop:1584 length:1308 start_codon:yes stop_codon:yes gene_type:complete